MTPSIWFALGPVILFAIIGGIVGTLFAWGAPDRFSSASWGIIIGTFSGAWWFFQGIVKALYPEKYYAYGYDYGDTQGTGPQVLAIDLTLAPNEHRWIECGLYPDEWRKICEAIHKTNKFTTAVFESVFGKDGRANYAKMAGPLSDPDVGILMQSGNGYAVTEGRGDYFFMRMATLPFPYPIQPDVLKMVSSSQRTQDSHAPGEVV